MKKKSRGGDQPLQPWTSSSSPLQTCSPLCILVSFSDAFFPPSYIFSSLPPFFLSKPFFFFIHGNPLLPSGLFHCVCVCVGLCVCVCVLPVKQNLKGEVSVVCQGHLVFLMSSPQSGEEEGQK